MQLLRHSREGGNPERCAGTTDLSRVNLDSRLRGNDGGRAELFALLPAVLPLPLGEDTSEGCLLLPLPLGEGRGEGSANPNPAFRFASQTTTVSPHPSPLPEGEGTKRMPLPEGEGTERMPLPLGEGTKRTPLPEGEGTNQIAHLPRLPPRSLRLCVELTPLPLQTPTPLPPPS